MQPDPAFTDLPSEFWAYVRAVSEAFGYSERGADCVKRPNEGDVLSCLRAISLASDPLNEELRGGTYLRTLVEYLHYRAEALNTHARPAFMNREEARAEFRRLKKALKPKCNIPMNKQKGPKRHEAYLTSMVNMLTEATLSSCEFDQDPRGLVTVRNEGRLLCTLARRVDGAYPTTNNPTAIWEVKEYYGTTTFGSRVADGIYETMLDGYELAQVRQQHGKHILHYLIVDDRFTWWECGRSYLCRIVDMLHAGLLDEAIFGRELILRWPEIVDTWTRV
jgi:hypothetical protein